jgi:hypothetical protein
MGGNFAIYVDCTGSRIVRTLEWKRQRSVGHVARMSGGRNCITNIFSILIDEDKIEVKQNWMFWRYFIKIGGTKAQKMDKTN